MSEARKLVVTCPGCKTPLQVKTRAAEKTIACPKCGMSLSVSDKGASSAAPVPVATFAANPFTDLTEPAVAPPATTPAEGGNAAAAAPAGVQRGLNEIGAAASVSAREINRLFQAGKNKIVERRLRHAADAELAALGERLHKANLGDADLRTQLAEVNEQILNLVAAKASTRAAADQQRGLRIRLAEPFLTQPAPSGLETEHERAVAAYQAWQAHRTAMTHAAGAVEPLTGRDRIRIAAMVSAAVLVIAVLAIGIKYAVGGRSSPPVVAQQGAPAPEATGPGGTVGNQQGVDAPDLQGTPDNSFGGGKQAAKERMDQALAAFQEVDAIYSADQARYRQQRDFALANAGRLKASGVRPPPVVPPDPQLAFRREQARQAYEQAKRAYEEAP
jgi:hypothetical protein